MPVRCLVVDDSAVVRKIFCGELSRDRDIEVVGSAGDAYEARDLIVRLRPDVITLDLEMPRMDGVSFLRRLMRHHPLPVVVVSSFAEEGGDRALEALDAGGVEVLCKPGPGLRVAELALQLTEAVKGAVRAPRPESHPIFAAQRSSPVTMPSTDDVVIAIGTSTGGPRALFQTLVRLPPDCPPVVVVQHMPAGFTRSFAQRLDQHCEVRVAEATEGRRLERGLVLVAPGNRHLVVERAPATGGAPPDAVARLRDGPLVSLHRPSVDVLFRSLIKSHRDRVIGVVLTGMGKDGAAGLSELRDVGGITVAQDENSSAVYGMPREAARRGAASDICGLSALPDLLARKVDLLSQPGQRSRSKS